MKVYFDPISTSSRPVMLLIHDFGLEVEEMPISLFLHENFTPAFLAINPNGAVPVLDDDGFILTEGCAILKYLAHKNRLPVYPEAFEKRIRVDQMLAWFTTNFWGFHCMMGTYPRILPEMSGLNEVTKAEMAAIGAMGSQRYLSVLDRWLGDAGPYVCGTDITIADYEGISVTTLAELVGFDFSPYPNVVAWMALMRQRKGWDAAFAGFSGMVRATRDDSLAASA